MNRSISRLYAVLTGAFLVLAVLVGFWQVVDANSLNHHANNRQAAERQLTVDRGKIVFADGTVGAHSVATKRQGQTVYRRVYDDGTLAPHVLGYAEPAQGTTGLEQKYNDYLAGDYGTGPILVRLRLRTAHGASLDTTLIPAAQRIANQQLLGRKGAVVALNPSTGAVLAMASSPGFDLSKVATEFDKIRTSQGSPLLNRATQGRYPPGSTFKVVTLTAALESNMGFTPTTRFDDTGVFRTSGPPITNSHGHAYGNHSLTDALTFSINTTFARIGTTLGADRLGRTMTAYGFGTKPPIDLPDSQVLASGRLNGNSILANDQQGEDVARIAIGQERLGVTPLQMAMVSAAIANKGTLMKPFIVQRVVDRSGSAVHENRPEQLSQVASQANAAAITDMMRNVVKEGTGTAAALQGLDVAGKTGTAETSVAGINDAWFIGFAPAAAPKVAVAVVIEGTPDAGGVAAAPVAREVMKAAIAGGG
ncbi:MAG: penicillin-binding protein 2 [Thermoleophilia bacterium]